MKCENIKCNKEHDGTYGSGRFCSRSCSNSKKCSKKTKDKISKTLKENFDKKIRYCLNCNNILTTRKQTKYCNNNCQRDYEYKQYIERWKNSLENGIQGKSKTSNYIHRYIREKYNNQCVICGWNKINETSGNVPVQLEHIDGHWDNNDEENLTLLCPNCHSLTSTYGNLNHGNGRKNRIM